LVCELEKVSPDFKRWLRQHDVHAGCSGTRMLLVDGEAMAFDHTSLTIDENRHLRMVVYARQQEDASAPD